jgi:serine/threonine protein kinase
MESKNLEKICVKLSDFGLSRIIERSTVATESAFPVVWTAIEGLKDAKYSKESDIWLGLCHAKSNRSYGVTMWEIFSDGAPPYKGIINVLEYLNRENRLQVPRDCPLVVWDLMTKCWKSERMERFDTIFGESITGVH